MDSFNSFVLFACESPRFTIIAKATSDVCVESTTAVPGASSFRVHSSCRLRYKEVRKEYTFQIIKRLSVHCSV